MNKTVYRIQTLDGEGLWYHPNGQMTSLITKSRSARCRSLAMSHDPSLQEGAWRSGTQSLEEMRVWISREEVNELAALGLHLWEVTVRDSHHRRTTLPYEHSVYLDSGVICQSLMSWDALY